MPTKRTTTTTTTTPPDVAAEAEAEASASRASAASAGSAPASAASAASTSAASASAPGSEEEPTPAPQTAEERAEALASELEAMNGRHLRLAADFDNFKRRARQERIELIQHASAMLAERLLPVAEDGGRALEHAPDGVDETWLKGLRLTFQKLDEALASVGVEPIPAVGQPFDPGLHEAIGTEESEELPDDTVLAELRPGYRMHDRVLRPALVKVSRRP
ncbi:MAG: nucleotide exchange factor GrpE [Candidatus Dormibacteraeota bacterium]|nr:nucleotide exchange factor GrpE [Candidatus Dormibacteraeota bacterium]